MEKYTIDELLDVLQWARDRAAYFRACNKPMPGALYAADCKAERDAEAELYRRGYYTAKQARHATNRKNVKLYADAPKSPYQGAERLRTWKEVKLS